MNLLTNAVSSMPEGGRIHIITENRYVDSELAGYETVQEGEYAVMVIADTGVGMSTEMQEHIFEPFYTKKKLGKSGSGLGMAVVWGTVKDHDGYIELESSEGEGSTFSIYFPATREEPKAASESRPEASPHGRGETVLVVDDVAQQRDLAQMILEKLGYVTLTAASGEEAIQMVKETPVDLLLLDMIMNPGIDGLETYREIVGLRAGQKAVIASGFSDGDRVKEAQKLGVGAYIRKPYTLNTLAEAVRLELDR
jgi:two-component system cell cycle sensor histidine kinase/response regulator CckA